MGIEKDVGLVRSIKYRWIYEQVDKSKVFELITKLSIPAPIAETLVKRGIVTSGEAETYFDVPLKDLVNPFFLKDMDKAVQRIAKAIFNREKICIYGDYDVDGITSTSLLYLFLKELNANVTYYVPNRLEEGYGLNKEAIDEICQKKINLMITVDCGITAVDEVAYAVDKGIDIIITDHHQQGERLPLKACAIVNPMRMDDTYPFKYLSGVGVAFKLVMALRYFLQNSPEYKFSLPNIKKYLDIVTLGTIADVVPLVGENRIFVKHGLKMLSEKSSRVGLEELKKITGLVNVSLNASHIGFVLAPRINAVGRMGCSDRGVRLLITEDKNEARWLAEELDMENRYRQGIEKTILAESYAKIERHRLHEKYRGIVLYSEDWHPGVIGIVASRVVEKYFRPTIVITMENGLGKGSARSIPAFHLYDGLKDISDLLVSFGGHKYAAGLKVEAENIKMLQKEFHKIISSQLNDEDFIPEINIDAIVEDSQINDELVQWLNKMRPFGSGNSEPVFLMKGLRKFQQFFYIGKDKKHIKGFLEKNGRVFQVIGYNMPEYEKILKNNEIFDIAFVPEYNTWLGEKTIQLKLKDIREAQ
ncbi:MAG: single-stranded-DNA-specific exonuclease [Deferribacteres bacterium]|jgi:single-stranded-DNA-specific exonuclease|nr:single-stranded-DNA-specific exonuclease RecJ [Deferribacteraceae bacterium]MDK2792568.1 single-stranded-DNA-specific exonuclease [Deferribacteres bacterium]